MATGTLDLHGLQALIDALRGRGYRVIGPRPRDGALVLADITSVDDLPRGVGDDQAAGHYRTRARGDEALFGFAATAQSAKPVLFPADEQLWRGTRAGAGFEVSPKEAEPAPVALLGIRGCDLAAIGIHDTVLLGRDAVDAHYAARRARSFLIAVTCASPAGTCFCASMGTGPRPGPGADLTLTELLEPHRFLVETGSPAGEELLAELAPAPATPTDLDAADAVVDAAVAQMGRTMRTDDLRDLLYASAASPRWNDVAERCLACTNCTMVCPTCFCTSVEDVSDLSGDVDERHRVWDSCFSMEYSRLHGGAVRTSTGARYRQWLTHKLAAWTDQFGTSGCVGCGRCITWCPAGIDLTAEVLVLREDATHREATPASAALVPLPPGGTPPHLSPQL
ncbi:MAG: 4Fe-4S dicluster domain-containing protein [Candidatus Nanopelagicales bacterium]|jgi:ferredoxin|nr:4Fe-4S dicluster domain-containing protein [Candidatus Nanopelagicales bacterium]